MASFTIHVQAPSWVPDLDNLEVIVDGAVVQTIPMPDEASWIPPATRLMMTDIQVPVASGGSWVVFHVNSSGDLGPVHPRDQPFAVSNPIFLTP